MTDQRQDLGYDLDDVLEASRPDQFAAFGDPMRQRIWYLLGQRAATGSQLAETLGQTKGRIAHHLKVLERAGFVRVVRTAQVGSITEKYYGKMARTVNFAGPREETDGIQPRFLLQQAIEEHTSLPEDADPNASVTLLQHARISESRAAEFVQKVNQLAGEFGVVEAEAGGRIYALVAGVFPSNLPELPEEGREGE